jgi:hypothetical protein
MKYVLYLKSAKSCINKKEFNSKKDAHDYARNFTSDEYFYACLYDNAPGVTDEAKLRLVSCWRPM